MKFIVSRASASVTQSEPPIPEAVFTGQTASGWNIWAAELTMERVLELAGAEGVIITVSGGEFNLTIYDSYAE